MNTPHQPHQPQVAELLERADNYLGRFTSPPEHYPYPISLVRDLAAALRKSHPSAPEQATEEMVTRFLGWKLPKDFNPDAGVSFVPPRDEWPHSWPIGTNLLNADQARAMLEHVLGVTNGR